MGTVFLWIMGVSFVLYLLGVLLDEVIVPLLEKLAYAVGYIIGILWLPIAIVLVIFGLGMFF